MDSGATRTCMSRRLIKNIQLEKLKSTDPSHAGGAFVGSVAAILGSAGVTLVTRNQQIRLEVEALVPAELVDDMLLGADMMRKHGMILDMNREELRWGNNIIPVAWESHRVATADIPPMPGEKSRTASDVLAINVVRICRTTKVQSDTRSHIQVLVPEPDGTVVMIEGHAEIDEKHVERDVVLPATVVRVLNGMVKIPVHCVSINQVKLRHPTPLGQYSVVKDDKITSMEIGDTQQLRTLLGTLNNTPDMDLKGGAAIAAELIDKKSTTETQRCLLRRLLYQHRALFDGTLGGCTLGQHTIDTGDAKPIHLPRRRYSQVEEQSIQKEIKELLEKGVIEPATGPWAAAVVLVKKKDGTWRFCIDYRAINKITKRDVYPLPRIDEALDQLGGAAFFTALDLNSGFWQLMMDVKDKEKTAFSTKYGLFQFNKMPMGLVNSPSTFQRVMDMVLRGMTWQICLVYMDDIIIYSPDFEHHIMHLHLVFTALEKAKLRLSAKKCKLAHDQLDYLGFSVGRNGLKPQERIVTSIQEFPTPTNGDQVRSFLMLASFYRRFVPSFACRSYALSQLLLKDSVFKWEEDEKGAFEDLKKALTTKPCLILPNFELPFTLATDAAQITGMGAVLMQDHGSGSQPIAYWSKSLNKAQKNYCVSESECLAMIMAIKFFRPYLYGRRFVLETDHKALEWLMSKNEPTGKLSRWALELQGYDFTVVYRKGTENVVADALSRFPCQRATIFLRTIRINGLQELQMSRKIISEAQLTDEWVQKALQRKKITDRKGEILLVSKEKDGVIIGTMDGLVRILLPNCLRQQALQAAHDSAYGGHFAVQRTMDRIEGIYIMENIFKYTNNWVAGCPDCGARKVKMAQVIPPLRAMSIGAIGDRWILDLLGPFTGTPRGNKYLIILMEYVTRYAIVCPTHSRQAEIIAAEVSRTLHTFGLGRELVSDGAGELAGRIAEEMCLLDQMKLTHPMPHRHQMTGLLDRFGRTFGDMLASYINQVQDDWDIHCFKLQYASNTATNRSMKTSPFTVMFGRDGLMPDSARVKVSEPFSRRSQQAMILARKVAKEELIKSQDVMTTWYERKMRSRHIFKKDDMVYVFWPGTSGPHVGKLRARWRGPFIITCEDVGHDNVGLVHRDSKENIMAHQSFLQPYKTRTALLESEAEKLMDAYAQAEKSRMVRPKLQDSPSNDVLDQGEMVERRRTRNSAGRPEVRFLVKESNGSERLKDIDGRQPPKKNAKGKRSPAFDEKTITEQPRSGRPLDSSDRYRSGRAHSIFGRNVPSIFEDLEDGSRGKNPI